MLLLGGSSETFLVGKGTFQELDAVSMLSPHMKLALRPANPQAVPSAIAQAYRAAFYGTPGTGFVDLPGDFLSSNVAAPSSSTMPLPPPNPAIAFPDDDRVRCVAELVKSASSPLVVIGKGSAYARAETVLRDLIGSTDLPFLPTPMGKGVIPDSHPCNTSSARSTALRHADVVLVLGARLNWM